MIHTSVSVKKRIAVLFLFVAATFGALNLRIAWLQFVRGADIQKQAVDNRLRKVPVEAKRGKILDRNGKELAVSISTPSVGAFLPEIKQSGREREIAEKVGAVLNIPAREVEKGFERNQSFWWIERKVPFDLGAKIRSLDLPGIQVVDESQRYYPNGSLASHVLGFAGIDNQGLEGVELRYDQQLRGTPGSLVIEKDAAGREIPQAQHAFNKPVDGNTIVLTLDETIQYIAERELDRLMLSATSPKNASVIVMDPKTGEILALANRPTFDPNTPLAAPQANRRNFAVSDNYEPGSTFKIVTTAAGLQEGVVRKEEQFYDPGYIKVGKEIVNCWRSGRPHGSQTFVEAVENSCNPVFVTVGLRLEDRSKGTFYKYINSFGFGKPTGVDLTGEAQGIMLAKDKLKPINIATISIGQGIAITPLQLISAVSAVANNGMLMQPSVVKEIRDSKDSPVAVTVPREVNKVISTEVAAELRGILEKVVSDGTGRAGYIPGYRVGGKTGTAQKVVNGRYQEGSYVASFIGMAPVNDPRLVVLVVIDEPKGIYYGGTIAAPVFKAVMLDALRYLNVPPQYDPSTELKEKTGQEHAEDVAVPDVVGLAVGKAQETIRAAGLAPALEGTGAVVVNQTPKSRAKVPPGTKVILSAGPGAENPGGNVSVPDVTGRRIQDAARILEALGLRVSPEGTGQAVEQDPVPGTRTPLGTQVKIRFQEPPSSVETISP